MKYVMLNGGAILDRATLYNALEKHLGTPEYFGRNLDALNDVLRGEILPAGALTMEILRVDLLRENLGGYADAFLRLLGDIEREDERFRVILS